MCYIDNVNDYSKTFTYRKTVKLIAHSRIEGNLMKKFVPDKNTALIFNIQHFCLHDGPGIRTTVFFNGCPLTCPWCCNPESIPLNPVLMFDIKACVLCGRCKDICPESAIKISNRQWEVDTGLCSGCGTCADICMAEALEISGKRYRIDQVAEEVEKDKAFYEKSGGGVTLSGGEVLMQLDFIESLSDRLHSRGITIACETTASGSLGEFGRLLNAADYFMIDIKHYDAEKLQRVCGADAFRIGENIALAVQSGKTVIGRIPVIPGFNHSIVDMEKFADYAESLALTEIHLLPFHQLGESKYTQMGKQYEMNQAGGVSKQDLTDYARYLKYRGFRVQIGG